MNKISIVLLTGSVILSALSSCSVTNVVHRDAKTAQLDCNVMVMPTVVELKVEDTPISAEATWTNELFKNVSFQQDETNNLIAAMLEEKGADILLEPKIEHNVTGSIINSTHNLKITGFPAKYSCFRTATLEDVMIINGINNPAPSSTVILADGLGVGYKGLSGEEKNALQIADAMKQRPSFVRRKGMRTFVGFGYGSWESVYVNAMCGYQFNPYLFAGIGLSYLASNGMYRRGGEVLYNDNTFLFCADVKAYLLKGSISPFIDVKAGAGALLEVEDFSPFLGAGVGVSIKHFELSLNYGYLEWPNDEHSLSVSIGYSF